MEEFASELEMRGIRLDNRLGSIPSGTIMVLADRIDLQLVWRQLLYNAIKKFRPEDNGKISFGYEDHGDEYVFNVWDSGKGVPSEKRDRLFEKYDSEKGSGLGLAKIKECIEKYGGRVWYENTEADHPNFKFALPKK
jgi:signal transduction histidine kinase